MSDVIQIIQFSSLPTAGNWTLSDGTNTCLFNYNDGNSTIAAAANSAALLGVTSWTCGGNYTTGITLDAGSASPPLGLLYVGTTGGGFAGLVTTGVSQTGSAGGGSGSLFQLVPYTGPYSSGGTVNYDWPFTTDGTETDVGNNATVTGGSISGSGFQFDGAGVDATADDSSMCSGSAFTLSFSYTPSAADIAGTDSGGTDSYFISWGSYSPALFAVGIAGGQFLCTDGYSQFPYFSYADTSTHNITISYDGVGTLTWVDNGGAPITNSFTMSLVPAGANGLLFGGIPGNIRTSSGLLSNVVYGGGSGGAGPTGTALTEEDFTITGGITNNSTWYYFTGTTGSDSEMSGNVGNCVSVTVDSHFCGYYTVGGGDSAGCIDFYSSLPAAALWNVAADGTDNTSFFASDLNAGSVGQDEIQTVTINSDVAGGTFNLTYYDSSGNPHGPYSYYWNEIGSTMQSDLNGIGYDEASVTLSGNTYTIDYGADAQQAITQLTCDGSSLTLSPLQYNNLSGPAITCSQTQLPIGPNAWWLNFNTNNDGSTFYVNVDGTDLGGYFGNSPGTLPSIVASYLQGVDSTFTCVDSTGSEPGGSDYNQPYLIQCANPHTLSVDNETGSPGDSITTASPQDQIYTVTINSAVNGGTFNTTVSGGFAGGGGTITNNYGDSSATYGYYFASELGISPSCGGSFSSGMTVDMGSGSQNDPTGMTVDGSGLSALYAVTAEVGYLYTATSGLAFGGTAPVSFGDNVYTGHGGLSFGSGATSVHTHEAKTGSGGLVYGSGATAHLQFHYSGNGGESYQGSSPAVFGFARVGSGGLTFGGSATPDTTQDNKTGSGGLTFGGSAPMYIHITPTVGGTLHFAGDPIIVRSYAYIMQGGLSVAGHSPGGPSDFGTMSGGLQFGSTAGVSHFNPPVYSYTASGTLHFNGTAFPDHDTFYEYASGGLSFGSSATVVEGFPWFASGGLGFGGAAEMYVDLTPTAGGTLTLAGSSRGKVHARPVITPNKISVGPRFTGTVSVDW